MEHRERWLGDCLGPTLAIGVASWVLIAAITVIYLF